MKKNYSNLNDGGGRRGLTLIELLIVIMILGIIMVMAIPRLRIISEDRSIREASRVAGSVFAKASQRAFTDGVAGVCIEVNPNIFDGDSVQYAGTALYMLQAVPPYTGDDVNSLATRRSRIDQLLELEIPTPYQPDLIQVNDYVSVNHSSIRYRIRGITVDGTITILALYPDVILPPLPGTNDTSRYPFVIHRQPRIQESSRVELPEGYIIDLRFSGELEAKVPPGLPESGNVPIRTVFHNPASQAPAIRNFETLVIFSDNGSIRQYSVPGDPGNPRFPKTDLHFFVAKYEQKLERETIRSANKATLDPDPLDSPSNMWLTVNARTGGVTMTYNAPPATNLTLAERIMQARSIAYTAQSAGD